jgi:hypothetical protein
MDPLTRHEKIPLACVSTRRINMMCWRLREFMLAQRAENANKRDPTKEIPDACRGGKSHSHPSATRRIIALHEEDWSGCLTIKHRIAPGLDM